MDCIFCKIVAGEIPADKVYEDDEYLAFLDIMPINPGHTLVIPKKHFKDMLDTPNEVLGEMIGIAKDIGAAIKKGLDIPAFNLGINVGREAGQAVFHVHFHVIPRFEGDGHKMWSEGSYKETEAKAVAEKIKRQLEG